MIRKLVIRRFKRFEEVEFLFPDNIVLAGPNNTGKTTVLQAVAAWSLAFMHWKRLNDFQRHGGAYTRAPIARQAFSAVPLRSFELLWSKRRQTQGPIEIAIHTGEWAITVEFIPDSTEQLYVRPKPDAAPAMVRTADLATAFVPAMSGLSVEEPLYQRAKVDQLLAQAKPGEVLRNLLAEAVQSNAWEPLRQAVKRLFGYEILPPDYANRPDILAEYSEHPGSHPLDIASAGSGFQQVLMLLAFLYTRPGSVLLLDEPDAHLHVILQDAIYGELRAVAAAQGSQLIIATHSEVIINSVEPKELYVMLSTPRRLADSAERTALIKSLGILGNDDILMALEAPGVLYLEDYTDLEILRAWARVLKHPALETLTTRLFWRKTVTQTRPGAAGIRNFDHYEALKLVRDDLPGLEIIDGDGRPEIQATPITGSGLQRLRWRRYEVESYLFHPEALARFVEKVVGSAAAPHVADLRHHLQQTQPPAFIVDPLGEHAFLVGVKARRDLIPPALTAAGIDVPYTRFHEIAELMLPDEIHPEVKEKLDLIQKAFGL